MFHMKGEQIMTKKEMVYAGISSAIMGFMLFTYAEIMYNLGTAGGIRWACNELKKAQTA